MQWKAALIPSEFARGPKPAGECWKATTDDGRPIQCLVWGTGTQAKPIQLFVRVGLPPVDHHLEEMEAPTLRAPWFEEIQEAIDHTTPRGGIIQLGMYTSRGRDPETEPAPLAQWIGMAVTQVGVEEGTAAARGSLILSQGGKADAN